MQEFKFRAWHTGVNEMLYEDYLGNVFQWLREKQPIKIMQYIGLKDRKNNKIYEGDIIKLGNIEIGFSNHKVQWNQENCSWKLSTFGGRLIESRIKIYEIIGNIYENSELLKE